MLPLESLVRENRPPGSESGGWKRRHGAERGTGMAKAAGNSYPHPPAAAVPGADSALFRNRPRSGP